MKITNKKKEIKRITTCILTLLLLAASPVFGQNAMDYFNLGQNGSVTRKKIAYFTKALELDPGFAPAYEKRGLLHYFQGNYNEMIQDYETYLELAAAKPEAYRMLGIGYLKLGFYEPAVHNFGRAIEMEPKRGTAYAYRAEAYRLRGKDGEALADANRAIKLRGDLRAKADAYKTRAKLYWKVGRNQLAAADLKASYRIDPRVPRWWRYFLNYASPEELRSAAPFFIVVILFVVIFGLRLKPPQK
ncbi:MAG: tetratricopeptide repeat protein [Deltaproteobacteria bacterium]|nr:MAG: tetratricopeptide repeat protein [Deltaproteobacteria bacterium]